MKKAGAVRPFLQSSCFRLILSCVVVLISLLFGTASSGRVPVQSQDAQASPHIYLEESHVLATTHKGPQKVAAALASGNAQALSLASGDFDEDGVTDLLIGYATSEGGILAVHRGNIDALAPQAPESFQAIAQGRFPSPFLFSSKAFK